MHYLSVQLIQNTLIQVNVTLKVCMHRAYNVVFLLAAGIVGDIYVKNTDGERKREMGAVLLNN